MDRDTKKSDEGLNWTCKDTDSDQNRNSIIVKQLPPIDTLVERFLQCCGCSDITSFLHQRQSILCLNSHSICITCVQEVQSCPFIFHDGSRCNASFVNIPQAPTIDIFNFLRSESHFYCPYWKAGCTDTVVGRSLGFHLEKECAFRPLSSCVFSECEQKGIVISDFISHIEYDHRVGVEVGDTFKTHIDIMDSDKQFGDKRFVLKILECYHSQFVIVMQETADKYFLWVRQCPSEDASMEIQYTACVELIDRFSYCSKRIKEIVGVWENVVEVKRFWYFRVQSIYQPVEEIIHLRECFQLSKSILLQNPSYYLGKRKNGSKYWRIGIAIHEVKSSALEKGTGPPVK